MGAPPLRHLMARSSFSGSWGTFRRDTAGSRRSSNGSLPNPRHRVCIPERQTGPFFRWEHYLPRRASVPLSVIFPSHREDRQPWNSSRTWMNARWSRSHRRDFSTPEYLIKKLGIAHYKGPGLAISSVEIEGPLLDAFPSTGHNLIFTGLERREMEPSIRRTKRIPYVPKFKITSADPVKDVLPVLSRFASHSFRRPVTDEDVSPFLILFKKR